MYSNIKSLPLLLFAMVFSLCSCSKEKNTLSDDSSKAMTSKFKNKAKYGEDISIYVDYSIPSSQPRFFVYDNRKDSLISKSKCAHGCGGGSTADKPVFSNTPGSVTIPVSKYISQGCFTISSNTFNLLRDEMTHNKTIYLYAYQSK